MKYYFLFSEGSKVNQILCGIIINIQAFAYGCSIGWMSPMTLLLQSNQSPRGTPMSDSEISWMAASAYLVCVAFDIIMAYMSDKLGRKLSMIFLSSCAASSWIILLVSMETWAFILARVLVGVTMAGCYVTCPLYTKEISEDSIRGLLGSFVTLFHVSGNLFLYIIGDILSYRMILWVSLAIPTIHLVLFMVMPESPSFLIKNGDFEEASRVVAWLRCREENHPAVQNELNLIKKEQKNDEESSKFALKAIFKDRILLRAFKIAMIVALAREVCGAIPVLNFAGDIFANASEGKSLFLTPNQQAMMLGAVQLAGSIVASCIVEKIGRKALLLAACLVSGLSMCGLASWFLARSYGVWAPSWLPIITLCICILADSAGLLPVSVVIIGEIFSYKYRGTVFAISMAAASLTDFIQMLFFKPLATAVGVHASFYFFGIVCLVAFVYVILVVPETRMRSLEEIYDDLKTKKEKEDERNRGKDDM